MTGSGPRLAIRTRASLHYGWGHLIRSLRLARTLQTCHPGLPVTLVVEGDHGVREIRHRWGEAWLELPEGIPAESELHWLDHVRPQILVVDLLEIPATLSRLFRERSDMLVAFNDTALPYADPDIIICPQVLDDYPSPRASQRWLCGPDYLVLDESFRRNGAPRRIRRKVKRVLVVMGGALPPDIQTWTLALLDSLKSAPFETRVVLGFDHSGAVERYSGVASSRFTFVEGTQELGRLMWEADVAVAASGYVKLELASAGTPALLVSLVDHQDTLGRSFAERTGAAQYLGSVSVVSPKAAVSALMALSADVETRRAMSRAGRRTVDGCGAERIERELLAAWEALQTTSFTGLGRTASGRSPNLSLDPAGQPPGGPVMPWRSDASPTEGCVFPGGVPNTPCT